MQYDQSWCKEAILSKKFMCQSIQIISGGDFMREITKTLTIPVDGKKMDFRLTKLDAFIFSFFLSRYIDNNCSYADTFFGPLTSGGNPDLKTLL